MGKRTHKGKIDPDKLIDLLSEEREDTFLPNKVFTDPTKAAPVERIVVHPEGGVDVYLKGLKYPREGYPLRQRVKDACIIKKTFLIFMNFFASMANKKEMIKLVLLKKNIQELISQMIILFSFIVGSRRLQQKYYSHAVREIFRAFSVMIEREDDPNLKKKWSRIRDVLCLVMEFDPAYRSRIQDFLSILDKSKIKLTKRDLYFFGPINHYRFGGKKRFRESGVKGE